jgi:hypothetical protein
MHTKITETTALLGLGYPSGRNLLKVASGPFSGRLAALVQTGENEIALFYSDPPYNTWSAPVVIDTAVRNDALNVLIDEDNDILVVYAEQTTGYLIFRRLEYNEGVWSVGAKVYIYSNGSCVSPSISLEPDGRLWASFSAYVQPNRNVYVKASGDNGVTWGTGAGDSGELLCSGFTDTHSRLVAGIGDTYLLYVAGSEHLQFRKIHHGASTWSEEQAVATGSYLDCDFDAALSPDGLLGVVYDDGGLKYREYDGVNWGVISTLDESPASSPQLIYRGATPVVVYLSPWAGDRGFVKYVHRRTGLFSQPALLDTRAKCFDAVLLYEDTTASYEDVSTPAANASPADVFHNSSGALLVDAGDSLYVGLDHPFRFLECHLSTAGSGGTLVHSYWDGVSWKAFTPVSGDVHLESLQNDIVLWQDYQGIPVDWQKQSIEGHDLFWVRLRVNSAYSTPPVADYLSSVSDVSAMSFRR